MDWRASRREGQILARMHHANIAQLIDAGVTATGQPYLVLEHVDGIAIDRYCDSRRLSVRDGSRSSSRFERRGPRANEPRPAPRLKPSNILVISRVA
jgi:serine/threonine protein kinase